MALSGNLKLTPVGVFLQENIARGIAVHVQNRALGQIGVVHGDGALGLNDLPGGLAIVDDGEALDVGLVLLRDSERRLLPPGGTRLRADLDQDLAPIPSGLVVPWRAP